MQPTINKTFEVMAYNCGIMKENIEKAIINEVQNQLFTYAIISFIMGIIAGYLIKKFAK